MWRDGMIYAANRGGVNNSLAVSMLRRFSSIFIISSGLLCICKVTNYLGIKCSEAKKSAKKSLKSLEDKRKTPIFSPE
jgi:hypothetical protein